MNRFQIFNKFFGKVNMNNLNTILVFVTNRCFDAVEENRGSSPE